MLIALHLAVRPLCWLAAVVAVEFAVARGRVAAAALGREPAGSRRGPTGQRVSGV